MRVGEDEPGLGHGYRQVDELARLVGVPRRVGVEQDGQAALGGLADHLRDGGIGDVEALGVRVQLEPGGTRGGHPVDLPEGGQAVGRVDRADGVEEAVGVLGELDHRVVAGTGPVQVTAVSDRERGGSADLGAIDQRTVGLGRVGRRDDLAFWIKHRVRVRIDDGAVIHGARP